jgi:3-deoxy-7-phosphoheptulonate synthase
MRVVLKHGVDATQAEIIIDFLQKKGIYYRFLENTPTIELILNAQGPVLEQMHRSPYVDLIASIVKDEYHRYFTNRRYCAKKNVIDVGGINFGGDNIPLIAGPCSIESQEHIHESAAKLSHLGVQILRGGAFKPRTSTYDFQGLGRKGLRYISEAAKTYGMLSVSEIMDTAEIDAFMSDIDIIQVGARNMQNFPLLKLLGTIQKPILLKRGLAASYHEFLNAAEYIAARGNERIILCERGIRTYEQFTQAMLLVGAILCLLLPMQLLQQVPMV